MARHVVKTQILYHQLESEAISEAPEHGVEVVEPGPELQAAVDAFARGDAATVEEIAVETHGVENPGELVAAFNDVIAKWTKLLDGISRADEAAMVSLVKSEIYDRIDETTYGLE